MSTIASSASVSPRRPPVTREGLTPKRRLELLCDSGSVQPFRATVRARRASARIEASDGVRVATGRVEGRPIVCYAQDPEIAAGSVGEAHADSIVRVLRLAGRAGVPVVAFVESGGARLQEGVAAMEGCARVLRAHAALCGRVPQICVVCGKSAGVGSYAAALTDFVIMTNRAAMFLTGPRVVRATIGEDVDAQALGGPPVHLVNGVCHALTRDDDDAASLARELLSYLPQHAGAALPTRGGVSPAASDPSACLPDSGRQAYDARDVIAGVVDDGQWLEVSSRWARNVLTGLARLRGRPIGVLASQPRHLGGLLDADAAQKATRFVRMCDDFGLPLVVLVDTPGFMPGLKQECAGIISHGAALIRVFAAARVPRITVILRKAYGGAYIALNSRDLGADLTFAWPGAEIGIMSAQAACDVLHRATTPSPRGEVLRACEEQHIGAWAAARAGFIDEVIQPNETRARLCAALEVLGCRSGDRETSRGVGLARFGSADGDVNWSV